MAIGTNATGSTSDSVKSYYGELEKATFEVTDASEGLRKKLLTADSKEEPDYQDVAAKAGHLQYLEETVKKKVKNADVTADGLVKVIFVLESHQEFAEELYRSLLATADLYYIYQHERLGVFRVMSKLQELFRAGTLRISSGEGAYGLYRFDKHGILRYHMRDRLRAYKRVFGYTRSDPGPGARPNPEFHGLFYHFVNETAQFWSDKRISDVIRQRAQDPSFGSIAIVRWAALDLRNNLKNSSYGYINVLRIETSQALAESFKVLESPDVRAQFGAQNAWDVIELVLWQYFHEAVYASTMNRMAVTGRDIIRWLAEPFVLNTNRASFETLLLRIAESAEEWLSSEEGMRLSAPTPPPRSVYMSGPPPAVPRPPSGVRRDPVFSRARSVRSASPVVG